VFESGQGGPDVLDLGACRRLLDDHMTGVDDASPQLWAAITLQSWLAANTAAGRPAIPTLDDAKTTHGSQRRFS
jgi:hypothetical protein